MDLRSISPPPAYQGSTTIPSGSISNRTLKLKDLPRNLENILPPPDTFRGRFRSANRSSNLPNGEDRKNSSNSPNRGQPVSISSRRPNEIFVYKNGTPKLPDRRSLKRNCCTGPPVIPPPEAFSGQHGKSKAPLPPLEVVGVGFTPVQQWGHQLPPKFTVTLPNTIFKRKTAKVGGKSSNSSASTCSSGSDGETDWRVPVYDNFKENVPDVTNILTTCRKESYLALKRNEAENQAPLRMAGNILTTMSPKPSYTDCLRKNHPRKQIPLIEPPPPPRGKSPGPKSPLAPKPWSCESYTLCSSASVQTDNCVTPNKIDQDGNPVGATKKLQTELILPTTEVVVGVALNTPERLAQDSVRNVSAEGIGKIEKRQFGTQTQIDLSLMKQLTFDPSLRLDTYTQTQEESPPKPSLPSTAVDEMGKKDSQGLISDPLQSLGLSILDAFGRRCISMHNISDWTSSKMFYLANWDGNSYRRNFSHGEAMLYTVMCQETFQQAHQEPTVPSPMNTTSTDAIPAELPIIRSPPVETTEFQRLRKLQDSKDVKRNNAKIDPTTPLEIHTLIPDKTVMSQETDTDDLEGWTSRSGSLCSENSLANSDESGYDADDELSWGDSSDEDVHELLTETLYEMFSLNAPTEHSSVEIVIQPGPYQRGSPSTQSSLSQSVSTERQDETVTVLGPKMPRTNILVSQVIPNLEKSIVKRIVKRGKLKATMSDYK